MSQPELPNCASDPRAAKILATAVDIFAREGFAQTDVQKIADAVGVGKGTIYRHFGSKEALFLAAARFARNQVLDEADAAAAGHECPLEGLRSSITSIIAFFDKHPEVVELLIQERAHFRGEHTPTFFDDADPRNEHWNQTFRELIERGYIRPLPIEQIKDTLSRFVVGAMFFNYLAGKRKPIEQQCNEMFDILLNGLLLRQ